MKTEFHCHWGLKPLYQENILGHLHLNLKVKIGGPFEILENSHFFLFLSVNDFSNFHFSFFPHGPLGYTIGTLGVYMYTYISFWNEHHVYGFLAKPNTFKVEICRAKNIEV